MIHRETVWRDEEHGELQYSLAALDDVWEMLYEATYACGPFHELPDVRARAHDDLRRWLRACGYQQELPL